MPLGAHMSIQGGVHKALARGREAGCETVQIFTKSNVQWAARPLADEEVTAFFKTQAETGISPVVGHGCYLVNLAATDRTIRRKSEATLRTELLRADRLRLPYLVIHPGSHMGAGEGEGLRKVADSLSAVLSSTAGLRTMILLETTAGQGSSLGYRFEHLRWVMDRTEGGRRRLGVCFDTCHAFAAGYDTRTEAKYRAVFAEFDAVIGLKRLKVFHLNDSVGGLGSRLDRHQHIGKGRLRLAPFRFLLNDARFAGLPMFLETPKGESDGRDWDVLNLAVLRRLRTGRRK